MFATTPSLIIATRSQTFETSSMLYRGTFNRLFENNTHIVDASNLRLPYTSLESDCYTNMFQGCSSIKSLPEKDTSNAKHMHGIFDGCSSLTTIEGISLKSYGESSIGNSTNSSIRKAVFKDIGYQSSVVQFNTANIENWGVNTSEIPDARQSLIDSLITYSFDRATAGYPTCTITLSTNTKALLTSDEISQINAKGFTIA